MNQKIAIGLAALFFNLATTLQADDAVEPFVYDDAHPVAGVWQGALSTPSASPRFVQIVIERGRNGILSIEFPQFSSRSPVTTCSDASVSGRYITFRCEIGKMAAAFRCEVSPDGQQLVGQVSVSSGKDEAVSEHSFSLRRSIRPNDLPSVRAFSGKAKHAGGMSADMALTIAATPRGNHVATIDIPMLGIRDFPLVDVVLEERRFSAKLPSPRPSAIRGEFDADQERFTGEFIQGELRFAIDFRHDASYLYRKLARPQHPKPPFPYRAREVIAPHPDGHVLAGTLTLPDEKQFGPGPYAAAVLITGGGQEDRDYSALGHKPFLVIADYLTRKGLAVMRYDDRGVGASRTKDHTPVGKESTSYLNATDTAAVVRRLRDIDEIDPERIGLIGHSEGGVIAPLVYGIDDRIAFIVLLAAPGVRGDEVFRKQFELSWTADGFDPAIVTKLSAAFAEFCKLIVADAPRERIDQSIEVLAKLQPQSELADSKERSHGLATLMREYEVFVSPWWRYMFGYDPQPVLAAIKCPVLAVNGMKDVQVWQTQNLPAIERAILEAGGDVTAKSYDGLNHVLQPAKTGLPDEYASIEITIDESVLRDMVLWLATKRLIPPQMKVGVAPENHTNQTDGSDPQSSHGTPVRKAERPERKTRSLGKLPDWAKESWFIRRQMDPPWMLRNANVIDINTGEVRQNVNIVIAGDQIQSINTDPPSGRMKIVDASGQYVIPGLFDLHAHVMPKTRLFPNSPAPEEALRLLIDAGVTTIRALPFYSESALLWAAKVNNGTLVGPTMVVASSILEKKRQRTMLGFGDPDTAAAWVRKEALLGARWIKVYNSMDEDSLRTIIETARQFGMKVCGHANEVPPHRASALGLATVEHATSIAYSCLRDGAGDAPGRVGLNQAAWYWQHADKEKLNRLMDTFLENGTAWVPTLVVLENITASGGHDKEFLNKNVIDGFQKALGESAKLAVQLHRDGGLIGIGTDFPVDGVTPGKSVHRELELFVQLGGATPLEALQMATISSARILGFDEILGAVEVGQLANLVLLAKNPLDNISHVRLVRRVIHDGRIYEPRSVE